MNRTLVYYVRGSFIRGCFVKYNIDRSDSLCSMFHALISVEIPKGCVEVSGNRYEYTRYQSCIDVRAFRFYYRTYGNSQIICIDARKFDQESDALYCFERITSEEILMQN